MTLWARVPWLGQLCRSSLLGKPLLSEDKCYEPFSDSPGVLTESGPKLGEDSVQLASPSGYDGLLAKFANSIVEPPRRHACTSGNSIHGSAVCAIPHILYFRGKKSGGSGVGEAWDFLLTPAAPLFIECADDPHHPSFSQSVRKRIGPGRQVLKLSFF
jgi:hypothetical protein